MASRHSSRPITRVLLASSIALAAGSACACSAEATPTAYRRGDNRSEPSITIPASQVAREPGYARTGRTVPSVRGERGRVDPFWIEQAAENDRHIWSQSASGQGTPQSQPSMSTGNEPVTLWEGRTVGSHVYVHPQNSQPEGVPSNPVGSPNLGSFRQVPGVGQLGEPDLGALTDGLDGLTRVTLATEGADFDPVVSRDGKFLVFASTRHRETSDIYRKSTSGSAVKQLTADPAQDVMPAISPDGSRIAFCSDRAGSWDIFVMSSGGGQAVQLTSTSSHEVHPSWSPDGTRLVFSRLGEVSRRWELWVMEVNSPSTAEFVGYGLFPEFSPVRSSDGTQRIVFQRSRERGDRAFSVWTIDYRPGDVSSPTEIASNRSEALVNPTWSPDGRWIVYSSVKDPAMRTGAPADPRSLPATDLWMTSLDGSAKVNLTAGRFENLMPTWSPDGKVYFVSNREGVSNIWAIGTDKAVAAATGGGSQPEMASVPSGGDSRE